MPTRRTPTEAPSPSRRPARARRPTHAELLARLEHELGDGDRRARPTCSACSSCACAAIDWRRAAEVAKDAARLRLPLVHRRHRLEPAPREGDEDAAATRRRRCSRPRSPTAPPAPTGRFQVFAHVQSTARHWGVTLKADVDERRAARRSRGCRCTRAPTGTSASAGRCTASCSTATPRCATSTSRRSSRGTRCARTTRCSRGS